MSIQTQNGKAFEYACLTSLVSYLNKANQAVYIFKTEAYQNAQKDFQNTAPKLQSRMELAANAAVRVLMQMEPRLGNSCGDTITLTIQKDSVGQDGDVRDIVTARSANKWEIGISCKHNHSAIKHSRLSSTIDFGYKWLGLSCSTDYFAEIMPIFNELDELRKLGTKWRDIIDKESKFYYPVLEAFLKELNRLYYNDKESTVPSSLVKYLLGKKDFYKIITRDKDKYTQILAFNIYGSLSQSFEAIKPNIKLKQLQMPNKIVNIEFKTASKNTLEIVCDNGWAISLRIHNAASLVEPSLKFDVQLTRVCSH